ncbi:MAG: hypothetical protein COV74_01480 [Candidatus Omnitrophica bacterium CG11_big_fil_rev_8_21_14_0_20_45_26]|uniref:STAS domain-containing protein n=1 Tax=Candidatus Abzuiibacterium crystallinum TaxID=1974748 RepID=A0A2H0LS09_9BACT|nr:MAG: hypothetical protein COV74_01480 [Candidatus Omnitrophica bacterium CG11_big_fil_rev_8_21_14_0_20_45_26]PIW64969.1 MAG: hypothetical protein COW12_03760 [Candidatus Omnitrophica bacterium CG12_big_fil_rev_8_21_14_0_65_45_16]
MKTLVPRIEQRQIGRVHVFDLYGSFTGDRSVPVIEKIDHTIQKKRLKRVILNMQEVQDLDELGARKILASLIRPQKSLVYCAGENLQQYFQSSYLPHNVKLCRNDEEVADCLGSFLFEKDKDIGLSKEQENFKNEYGLERRRKKRIRVAIPIEIEFEMKSGTKVHSKAIATNISQGGLFAEYLDLDSSLQVTQLGDLESNKVTVVVPANENFPEDVRIQGCVKRIELTKRQVGMGIQFV